MTKQLFIFLAIAMVISSCGTACRGNPYISRRCRQLPRQKYNRQTCLSPPLRLFVFHPNPRKGILTVRSPTLGKHSARPDWQKDFSVGEGRVTVTWQNTPLGAVVFLEALIFPCSYEEPDLNAYFSDENWNAVFANYESYELIDECKTNDGLRLYEFKTHNQGFDYEIRYWVENDTDTRVIVTMIVFPLESELLLDEYSSMLFPDYSTCP